MRQKTGIHRNCNVCSKEFYVHGFRIEDNQRGKFCSMSCYYESRRGIRVSPNTEFKKGENIGDRHRLWKGNDVGYGALHAWLERHYEKVQCDECASSHVLQWANIDGQYKRDRENWKVLCRSCHAKYDAKLAKIPLSRFNYGDL